ncbi:MAG: class I SAM-dependent methyltransferase [Rubrivivax sp.]|nr:class I SAM-dependent methyltransferase [Rubrivivax sp.]
MLLIDGGAAPAAWVQRFVGLIRPGGSVLDVACGSRGRHLRWLAAQGFAVTGIDRDPAAAEDLPATAQVLIADIEAGPWPLPGRRFDAVLVTNYLWRALWPALHEALVDDGVLIYETFAQGQQTVGRPSRPEFLLRPGELLQAFAGLRVVAFEDGFEPEEPRFVQRIVAVKASAGIVEPARYRLSGPAR